MSWLQGRTAPEDPHRCQAGHRHEGRSRTTRAGLRQEPGSPTCRPPEVPPLVLVRMKSSWPGPMVIILPSAAGLVDPALYPTPTHTSSFAASAFTGSRKTHRPTTAAAPIAHAASRNTAE